MEKVKRYDLRNVWASDKSTWHVPETGLITSMTVHDVRIPIDPPIPIEAGERFRLEPVEDGTFRKVNLD